MHSQPALTLQALAMRKLLTTKRKNGFLLLLSNRALPMAESCTTMSAAATGTEGQPPHAMPTHITLGTSIQHTRAAKQRHSQNYDKNPTAL